MREGGRAARRRTGLLAFWATRSILIMRRQLLSLSLLLLLLCCCYCYCCCCCCYSGSRIRIVIIVIAGLCFRSLFGASSFVPFCHLLSCSLPLPLSLSLSLSVCLTHLLTLRHVVPILAGAFYSNFWPHSQSTILSATATTTTARTAACCIVNSSSNAIRGRLRLSRHLCVCVCV